MFITCKTVCEWQSMLICPTRAHPLCETADEFSLASHNIWKKLRILKLSHEANGSVRQCVVKWVKESYQYCCCTLLTLSVSWWWINCSCYKKLFIQFSTICKHAAKPALFNNFRYMASRIGENFHSKPLQNAKF